MDELKGDCAQCFGLCCVALPFAKSAEAAKGRATQHSPKHRAQSPCRSARSTV